MTGVRHPSAVLGLRLHAALALASLLLLISAGCRTRDPLYCERNEDCTDPDRPYCDLTGDLPGSEGLAKTCVPDPNPMTDGGPGGADASPDGGPGATCSGAGDCGAHEYCDTTNNGGTCACAPGYVGTPCQWGTVPADPGFQDPTAWTVTGAATITPAATGSVDAGEGFFNSNALCKLEVISQDLDMPTYAQGEPLVIELTYRSLAGDPQKPIGLAFAIGDAWTDLPGSTTWTTQRRCLGSAAYGGTRTLKLSPAAKDAGCPSSATASVAVDHVIIEPAAPDECPTPGTALNGDMEAAHGWSFTANGGATAAFANNQGQSNTRASRLATTKYCQDASLSGTISVPAGSPNPALEFWWRATSDAPIRMKLDGRPLTTLRGDGTSQKTRMCLQEWAQGAGRAFRVELSSGTGPCGDTRPLELLLDDLRVVGDAACGTGALVDPGFESATSYPTVAGADLEATHGSVTALNSTSHAYAGSGVLALSTLQPGTYVRYWRWFVVPPSTGSQGPALTLWHKVISTPGIVGPGYTSIGGAALSGDGSWKSETLCLDPAYAGRPQPVGFAIFGGPCFNNCPPFDDPYTSYFDQLAITTSASCPSE